MKKQFIFGCSFFLFGCTTPPIIGYLTELQNACNYPVQVTVAKYTHPLLLEQKLESGDRALVLQIICADERSFLFSGLKKLKKCFPKDYTITINAGNKQHILDDEDFLKALEKTKITKHGGSIYHWVIKDPSLCP